MGNLSLLRGDLLNFKKDVYRSSCGGVGRLDRGVVGMPGTKDCLFDMEFLGWMFHNLSKKPWRVGEGSIREKGGVDDRGH